MRPRRSSRKPRRRLIAVHHRLAGRTGHRFQEALGLLDEAPRRGFEPVVFIHEAAEPAVRAALPEALAVLHDPVFRTDQSFDDRTRDFVQMLHQHVDDAVRRDDVVLMTVATQCEARAMAAWLRDLPREQKPFVVLLFHSDRWNRYGAAEHARQRAEFATVARELAALAPEDLTRLLCGATTEALARELSTLLGVAVHAAPLTAVYDARLRTGTRPVNTGAPPCVGLLGGARHEKGSHLVPRIVEECRRRTQVRFLVQLANELLPPDAWEDLQRLAAEPDVDVVHGGLSVEEYADAICRCDILLFPYDHLAYRQRSSGIFADAVAAGRAVAVPEEIWIGTLVARGEAAGVVYRSDAPVERSAEAVAECVRRLPELRERARTLAPEWIARQSLSAFFDWVEAGLPRTRSTGVCGFLRARTAPWMVPPLLVLLLLAFVLLLLRP